MTLDERPPKMRWHRTQRFELTERGRAAETEYRQNIVTSRAEPGRKSFDAARLGWATTHQLNADDGLYLAELADGAFEEILRNLIAH